MKSDEVVKLLEEWFAAKEALSIAQMNAASAYSHLIDAALELKREREAEKAAH